MNLDELKPLWQHYDKKIKDTATIDKRIISSMIRERSGQRLERFRREHHFFLVLMAVWIIVFIAVIAGNPFDFTYAVQYIPTALMLGWATFMLVKLLTGYKMFRTDFNHPDLEQSLRNLIKLYKQYNRFTPWIVLIMMTGGLLFSFSFLPAKIETRGIWMAIGESLLGVVIAFVIYFAAYKMGAFKDRYELKFQRDLQELEELRSMADELK